MWLEVVFFIGGNLSLNIVLFCFILLTLKLHLEFDFVLIYGNAGVIVILFYVVEFEIEVGT